MAKEQDRDAGLQTRRARKPKEVDPLPELSGEPRPWTLGDRLAFLRRQRGFTQKQFSELVGKARATIIQYEQGRLQPPLQQIEAMAKVLEVAPELLAFGRQGITGLGRESADVTSLPEVEVDGREDVVTGGHGLAKSLVDHLGIEPGQAKVYVLAEAAPAFGLAKGDRIIVNRESELTQDNRLYALRTPGGVTVARLLPSLSKSSSHVNLNGGHGETASYDPSELTILGMVVGSIQAR